MKQPYIRLTEDDGDVQIWLQPYEDGHRHTGGLCLGVGTTRAEAMQDARDSLADAAQQLEHLENRS